MHNPKLLSSFRYWLLTGCILLFGTQVGCEYDFHHETSIFNQTSEPLRVITSNYLLELDTIVIQPNTKEVVLEYVEPTSRVSTETPCYPYVDNIDTIIHEGGKQVSLFWQTDSSWVVEEFTRFTYQSCVLTIAESDLE